MKKETEIDSSIIYESIQLEAIEGKLTNSLQSFERKIRRWYSREFSTPLLDTYKLSWNFILLNYYEDTLEQISYNELFDKTISEYLPEFKKQTEEEDETFAQSLIEEQKQTMLKKAKRDEKYRKKLEQTHEIINKLDKTSKKLDNTMQTLNKPKNINLTFDEEE